MCMPDSSWQGFWFQINHIVCNPLFIDAIIYASIPCPWSSFVLLKTPWCWIVSKCYIWLSESPFSFWRTFQINTMLQPNSPWGEVSHKQHIHAPKGHCCVHFSIPSFYKSGHLHIIIRKCEILDKSAYLRDKSEHICREHTHFIYC